MTSRYAAPISRWAPRYARLSVTNHGAQPRSLSIFGVVEWVLGGVQDGDFALEDRDERIAPIAHAE